MKVVTHFLLNSVGNWLVFFLTPPSIRSPIRLKTVQNGKILLKINPDVQVKHKHMDVFSIFTFFGRKSVVNVNLKYYVISHSSCC